MMNRRGFLSAGLMAGAALAMGKASRAAAPAAAAPASAGRFKLRYAPHFNMFKEHAGADLVDQLKFMADQGFTALEDNWMSRRPREEQDRIAAEMDRLGMTMGVFVVHADFKAKTFVLKDPAIRKQLVEEAKAAVELAGRVRAKWTTCVPDMIEPLLAWDYQTANVIENLRAMAEVMEPSGLVMVLEPLNRETPAMFLTGVPQAYAICKAVDSPSCKILDDLWHQQVTEGNLIPNIDLAWDEIAYIQVGDNPGRKEPGTGEINYRNVFRHLYKKGYKGIVGMEHGMVGKGIEGEKALLAAYAAADDFEV